MGIGTPLHRHIGGVDGRGIGFGRFGNPARQRREFHGLQEGNEFRAVLRFEHQGLKRLFQRHIGPERYKLSGKAGKLRISNDIFPAFLLLDFIRTRQKGIEIAVFLQQLRRRLRANAGNAGDIIGGVAGHRLKVDHLFGTYAPFFDDIGNADLLVLHGVVHVHIGRDELHQILVGRDDGDIGADGLRLAGIGGDDIVRLEALRLDAGKVEGACRFADQAELRNKVFRWRAAVGLVEIIKLIAECLRRIIEYDREMCGVTPTSVLRASFRSFHNMLQKPETALTGSPSDLRFSGGMAWNARKMKPEPSTRKR